MSEVAPSRLLLPMFCVLAALAGAPLALSPSAQARTVCGSTPALGLGYAVSAAHLTLSLTAHFQDAAGDHQDATVSMSYRLAHRQPPDDQFNGALFNWCRPGSGPGVSYLPVGGEWFSYFTTVPRPTYNVSVSWYDSGVETYNPPSSGSCQGSYRAGTRIDGAMNGDLDSPTPGVSKIGRTPRFFILVDGPGNLQIGGCDASYNGLEVLYDTVGYDIYSRVFKLSLPLRRLRHSATRIVMPFSVTYSQRPGPNGNQSLDAGASTVLTAHWQGSITYSRAYSCQPNGCRLPTRFPIPAALSQDQLSFHLAPPAG